MQAIHSDLILRFLITSAKTFFPDKDSLTDSEG